jgi:hypothetical protein
MGRFNACPTTFAKLDLFDEVQEPGQMLRKKRQWSLKAWVGSGAKPGESWKDEHPDTDWVFVQRNGFGPSDLQPTAMC